MRSPGSQKVTVVPTPFWLSMATGAAMQLDEADGERQAQAGAGMLAVPGTRDLAEARHRGRDLGLVHADAAGR